IVFNGEMYFSATNELGTEVWKTDGTEAGTVMVKDIRPGPESSIATFAIFKIFNGRVYFAADDGVNGYELWQTDGTSAGTILFELTPGSDGTLLGDLVPSGSNLFICLSSFTGGAYLWKTDG